MPGEKPREILFVEDTEEDVELTMDTLKECTGDMAIRVAGDGAQALDYLFAQDGASRVDLILLDLKLPKVNGLEVLRRVKSDERTRRIPVVVLTSSAEELDLTRSYDLGANSYIVKPVVYENFVKAVQDAGAYWLVLNRRPKGRETVPGQGN